MEAANRNQGRFGDTVGLELGEKEVRGGLVKRGHGLVGRWGIESAPIPHNDICETKTFTLDNIFC